jgi:hypothetical protein
VLYVVDAENIRLLPTSDEVAFEDTDTVKAGFDPVTFSVKSETNVEAIVVRVVEPGDTQFGGLSIIWREVWYRPVKLYPIPEMVLFCNEVGVGTTILGLLHISKVEDPRVGQRVHFTDVYGGNPPIHQPVQELRDPVATALGP